MKIHPSNITGIVLVGGKSSRMGTDKGLLFFQGKSFVERILEALKPLTSEILIVGNQEAYDQFQGKRVNDLWEAAGPLAAIYTGLYHSTSEHNLVVSCDVPLINSRILKLLINENTPSHDIVYIESQKRAMPLIALYKRRCMQPCLDFLNSCERRVMELLHKMNSKAVSLSEELQPLVVNVNTKNDLKALSK